jgi:protein involved in polysaccharide export with SLBB domain
MKIPRLINPFGIFLAGLMLWTAEAAAVLGEEEAPSRPADNEPAIQETTSAEKTAPPASQNAGADKLDAEAAEKETAPATETPAVGEKNDLPALKEAAPGEKTSASTGNKNAANPKSATTTSGSRPSKASVRSSKSAARAAAPAADKPAEFVAVGTVPAATPLSGEDAEPAAEDHRIAPLETLHIDVFAEKDLTMPEVRVQASGKIKYFLLGDIQVAGKTSRQVADYIQDSLIERKLLVNPQVVVTVVQYRLRYVNVLGEVVQPKAYPLQNETQWTLVDAIGTAGGLTRAAKRSGIQFTRRGKTTIYDIDKLIKNPQLQIIVEPGDTIFVPPTFW